jgi:hydrogenase nickel incorporation protein HypB
MCGICGCDDRVAEEHHGHDHHHHPRVAEETSAARVLRLEHAVLEKNDRFAAENRGFFAGRGVLAINLWSAPGSGKTSLIERVARDIGGELRLSVIEGDLATDRDAARVRAAGANVVQINTGAVCHLDAHMVGHALEDLALKPESVLIIENVGNLVCPAMFDLGEHERVALLSVTEGEDKPIKYPHMFVKSTAVILSKVDLLPHVSFDIEEAKAFVRQVNPRAPTFALSARTGEGLDSFYQWVKARASSTIGKRVVETGA